jgi:hypothetical protein
MLVDVSCLVRHDAFDARPPETGRIAQPAAFRASAGKLKQFAAEIASVQSNKSRSGFP